MQEFLNWTIDTIREDRLLSSWLEEKKYEWVPLVSKSIVKILNKNHSVIVVTDNDREWFLEYILTNINHPKFNRPFLPFYDFRSFYKQIEYKKNSDENDGNISNIKDMLNISFPQGYTFWYIGKGQDIRAKLAKMSKNSFLWLLDEERQNSFNLKSDDALDMKLIQMFRLYNKTLGAALFADINVEN